MPVVNYRLGARSADMPYAAPDGAAILDTVDYGQGPTAEYTVDPPGYPLPVPHGWAPTLDESPTGIPDAERLGSEPIRGTRGAPQFLRRFYRRKDADAARRHSVEQIDADGWAENKGATANELRFAPNPLSTPAPETRWTQQQSPNTYSFVRPFGNGLDGVPKAPARALSGEHFSMASHRRTYEIYGMQPRRSWRNTYRLTPEPWDEDIVDMPDDADSSVNAVYVSPVVGQNRSRTYRLG